MSGTWNPGPGATAGNDTFTGTVGGDNANGLGGNDSLSGLAGADTLFGGLGADTLLGGTENDILAGDNGTTDSLGGNDYIDGGDGNDSLYGNAGNDTLLGGIGDDAVFGNDGNDYIDAGDGNDLVQGGAGNDTVIAGTGVNTITGGAGNDSLVGGNGNDIYYVGLNQGSDTIADGGGQDTLYIQGFTVAGGGSSVGWSSLKDGVYGDWTFVSGTANSGVFVHGTDSVYADNSINIIANGDSIVIPPDTTPCFATGTRIATARGEVAVEDLRVGDLVVCAGGGAALQPVVWLGHSEVNVARHTAPERVQPILIKAGALGKGVPFRDLRVSPDHAMFLDGHLVPAGLLVNGTSIVREAWCPRVTYWHVELPGHAVLMAEGAAAESYLDDGNRKHFDNGAIAMLFKDFASERENGIYDREACYPVLRGGAKLDAIRAKLAQPMPAQGSRSARRA